MFRLGVEDTATTGEIPTTSNGLRAELKEAKDKDIDG